MHPKDPKEALDEAIAHKKPLKDVSRLYAAYILAELNNNKVHASAALGVDRRSLQRWCKQAEGAT